MMLFSSGVVDLLLECKVFGKRRLTRVIVLTRDEIVRFALS